MVASPVLRCLDKLDMTKSLHIQQQTPPTPLRTYSIYYLQRHAPCT